MNKRFMMAVALASSMAGTSHAENRGNEAFSLRGECSAMQLGTDDMTRFCQGKLVSFTTANGRVGFIFLIGDEGILQFSGAGAKQTRLAGERASQPIDRVRFTLSKTAPDAATSNAATGHCVYGNPFAGASKVTCRVISAKRTFVAEFVTDGTPPASAEL